MTTRDFFAIEYKLFTPLQNLHLWLMLQIIADQAAMDATGLEITLMDKNLVISRSKGMAMG